MTEVRSKPSRDTLLRRLHKAHETWPTRLEDRAALVEKAFLALDEEAQRLALALQADYVEILSGKVCRYNLYFSERRWERLTDADFAELARRRAAPKFVPVPPFGKLWFALRMRALLAGPEAINLPLDLRASTEEFYAGWVQINPERGQRLLARRGVAVATDGTLIFPEDFETRDIVRRYRDEGYPEVKRLHEDALARRAGSTDAAHAPLADLVEAVPAGSQLLAEWRALEEVTGWPLLPDMGSHPGHAYYPPGGPDELGAFQQAVKAILGEGR
ncbi:hypothetical protein BJF92_12120 [Rhizobium rhizosphaerae]|uniref:Uncharacterized protein n=1 Tax=Xaviernesmea rhizosphaerae TaxID=1672749 RepID=A0A1Q9AN35_9HYPH|nr:hypothetical protein [Xaviernesmea rhizosphaerae]OLP56810.1 hypothetical protein BJF92_12120 [Xaviernesmea rhizosphaerae]